MYRNVATEMSPDRDGQTDSARPIRPDRFGQTEMAQTEMSPDRNGQTEMAQTEMAQTETVRPKWLRPKWLRPKWPDRQVVYPFYYNCSLCATQNWSYLQSNLKHTK